jgi:hypothetical protein
VLRKRAEHFRLANIKSACNEPDECEGWRGRQGKKVESACGAAAFTADFAADALVNMGVAHVISPEGLLGDVVRSATGSSLDPMRRCLVSMLEMVVALTICVFIALAPSFGYPFAY